MREAGYVTRMDRDEWSVYNFVWKPEGIRAHSIDLGVDGRITMKLI
jgi:hypothetical protein